MPSDARYAFNHQVERRLREALTSSSDELELAKVQLQEAQLRLSATVNEARETRKQLKLQAAAIRLEPSVPATLRTQPDTCPTTAFWYPGPPRLVPFLASAGPQAAAAAPAACLPGRAGAARCEADGPVPALHHHVLLLGRRRRCRCRGPVSTHDQQRCCCQLRPASAVHSRRPLAIPTQRRVVSGHRRCRPEVQANASRFSLRCRGDSGGDGHARFHTCAVSLFTTIGGRVSTSEFSKAQLEFCPQSCNRWGVSAPALAAVPSVAGRVGASPAT